MNDHPAKKQKLPTDKLFAVGTDMAAMYYSMLQEQFFLPADAIEFLEASGWEIQPIAVMSGRQWQRGVRASDIFYKYEPSKNIIDAAQYVGVSIRQHFKSNTVYVLVKLWFPAIDTDR